MGFEAKILLDSISPAGHRLTTFQLTFPRVILAEFNTHRAISRNAASSRAIPLKKMIEQVMTDPFVPMVWPLNQPGMQGSHEMADPVYCLKEWLIARDNAVKSAQALERVHKSLPNRLLEPWLFTTVIASATEWENFFYLRQNENLIPQPLREWKDLLQLIDLDFPAEPHMQVIAGMARLHYRASTPTLRRAEAWHLPLVIGNDLDYLMNEYPNQDETWAKISVGRCARVSYLTHDGKREPKADIELHDRLLKDLHLSPFEHAAQCDPNLEKGQGTSAWGNFRGWSQYRKMLPGENQTKPRAAGDKRG